MIWVMVADIAPPGLISGLGIGRSLGWLAALLTLLAGLVAFLTPRAWAVFHGWPLSEPAAAAFVRAGGGVLIGLGLLGILGSRRHAVAETLLLLIALAWGLQLAARLVSRLAERDLPRGSGRGIALEVSIAAVAVLALAERWNL